MTQHNVPEDFLNVLKVAVVIHGLMVVYYRCHYM